MNSNEQKVVPLRAPWPPPRGLAAAPSTMEYQALRLVFVLSRMELKVWGSVERQTRHRT